MTEFEQIKSCLLRNTVQRYNISANLRRKGGKYYEFLVKFGGTAHGSRPKERQQTTFPCEECGNLGIKS